MNIKILKLILLSLLVSIISGCVCLGSNIAKERNKVFRITVTSIPSEADIYFNGALMGKTPVKSLPIKVRYYTNPGCYTFTKLPSSYTTEVYYLYVKKEGYKSLVTELNFINLGSKIDLSDYDYHFEMKKE